MSYKIRLIPVLLVLPLLALFYTLLLAQQAVPEEDRGRAPTLADDGSWPMMGQNSGRTGLNPVAGVFKPPLTFFDEIPLDSDAGQLQDVISDAERIFARNAFFVWAVDKTSKAVLWKFDCITELCIVDDFAADQGKVVIKVRYLDALNFNFDHEIVVLRADTGAELWRRNAGLSAVFVLDDDRLQILSSEDDGQEYLTTRSLLSGVSLLRKEINDFSGVARPAIALDRLFVVESPTNEIVAYSTVNGDELWRYTDTGATPASQYQLVALNDRLLLIQNERVINLNTTTNPLDRVVWSTDVASPNCANHATSGATDGTYLVVAGVCEDEVVVLNLSDGTEHWREQIGRVGIPAVAIANGYLYTYHQGTGNYVISAVDIANGPPVHQLLRQLSETSAVMAIDDGMLLTASIFDNNSITRFERQPADLSAAVDTSQLPACGTVVGGSTTLYFEVTNNGPGEAEGVTGQLKLPDGTYTVTPSQGSCNGSLLCNLGDLEAGATAHITVTIEFATAGNHRPSLTLSGPVRDPDATNDTVKVPAAIVVDPKPSDTLDLQVLNMEITQGIQNLANDVRLVEGKPTFVRVYAKTDGDQVRTASAELHGFDVTNNQFLPGSPLSPMPVAQCATLDGDDPDRSLLAESYLFELPEVWWKSEIKFTVEINPDDALPDVNAINDTLEVTREFTKLPPICLRTYPVRTTENDGDNRSDDLLILFTVLHSDPDNILGRALTMLPTAEIKIFAESNEIEEWEPFEPGGYGPYELDDSDQGDILDTLWWHRAVFTDEIPECAAVGARTHYMGLVHEDTRGGKSGLARGDQESWVRLSSWGQGAEGFDDPFGGMTMAHELGHNYNRPHVGCGPPNNQPKNAGPYPSDRNVCDIAPDDPAGYYGLDTFDITAPEVITPTQAGDIMSYHPEVWMSEFTWEKIQNRLCADNGCTWPSNNLKLATETALTTSSGELLILSGIISDTVQVQHVYRLPASEVPEAQAIYAEQAAARANGSDYALKLLDSGGGLLHTEPFTPTILADSTITLTHFGLAVPFITGTVEIVIEAAGLSPISLAISANPPTVTVISPNGGETVDDPLTVSWTGSDPDGDDLRYTVRYSADGGLSWRTLVLGTSQTSLTVDSSLLPGSQAQSLVEVIANDGVNTAADRSDAPFTVPNRRPIAAIRFPDDGAIYASGSSLTLRGLGYDAEDGTLPTTVLSWTLTTQGGLGYGNYLKLAGLADGEYTLSLTVTDADDQTSSTSVTFQIRDINPPLPPNLLSPTNGDVIRNTTPTFDWDPSTDAVVYQLQVDNNGDFSSPEINTTGSETEHTPTSALADDTYYWRVRAKDDAGNWSEWTADWSFEIDTFAVYLPTIIKP